MQIIIPSRPDTLMRQQNSAPLVNGGRDAKGVQRT